MHTQATRKGLGRTSSLWWRLCHAERVRLGDEEEGWRPAGNARSHPRRLHKSPTRARSHFFGSSRMPVSALPERRGRDGRLGPDQGGPSWTSQGPRVRRRAHRARQSVPRSPPLPPPRRLPQPPRRRQKHPRAPSLLLRVLRVLRGTRALLLRERRPTEHREDGARVLVGRPPPRPADRESGGLASTPRRRFEPVGPFGRSPLHVELRPLDAEDERANVERMQGLRSANPASRAGVGTK